MKLRNNLFLNFFPVLLFSFELFAIFFSTLYTHSNEKLYAARKGVTIQAAYQLIDFFLLEEKDSEEERESKHELLAYTEIVLFDCSNFLSIATRPSTIPPHHHNRWYDTHPPLFKLHQFFLI